MNGIIIVSHDGHSITTALVVAALAAVGETIMSGREGVNIFFPGFEETLRRFP